MLILSVTDQIECVSYIPDNLMLHFQKEKEKLRQFKDVGGNECGKKYNMIIAKVYQNLNRILMCGMY